jgi:uncharacterized protein (TIGR04255 family)
MTTILKFPLGGSPPPEVPLANAPLDRVIAQVQFSSVSRIEDRSYVLSTNIPSISPKLRPVWRFLDAEKNWRISLSSETISLEVKKYSSRTDFLYRWSEIIEAASTRFTPTLAVRVGLRYINRIKGDRIKDISTLVDQDFLGPLVSEFQDQVQHSISETALHVEEGNLLLRLGKLPKGGTIDPNLLEAISEESYFIDIDVSSAEQRQFVPSDLSDLFHRFAKREYAVFRKVVTAEFITSYGG